MTTSQHRVLVVDDEEGIREYLRLLLQHTGYQVWTAADGKEALELLGVVTVDLIVLDLMMPVLDGWELIEVMRSDPRLCAIPVVVLSAVEHAPPKGAAAILIKPSSRVEILGVIARLLDRDRRCGPRFAAMFAVRTVDHTGAVSTTTHDVSRGGLSFDFAHKAPIGQRFELTLELGDHGAVLLEAEVCNVAASLDRWRVGARFIAIRKNAAGFASALSALEGEKK